MRYAGYRLSGVKKGARITIPCTPNSSFQKIFGENLIASPMTRVGYGRYPSRAKVWQTSILYGGLAELVDASDLGSDAMCVWVRVPCPLLAASGAGRARVGHKQTFRR